MEIIQGVVRNYVVTNKEKFCDALASTLCKQNISYVQIGNEFHFDDKIYRFYNFGDSIELSEMVTFVCLDREKVLTISPRDLLFAKESEPLGRVFDPLAEEDFYKEDDSYEEKKPNGKVFTKKDLRRDSKIVNQKIKNNYRQPMHRNRRNG